MPTKSKIKLTGTFVTYIRYLHYINHHEIPVFWYPIGPILVKKVPLRRVT